MFTFGHQAKSELYSAVSFQATSTFRNFFFFFQPRVSSQMIPPPASIKWCSYMQKHNLYLFYQIIPLWSEKWIINHADRTEKEAMQQLFFFFLPFFWPAEILIFVYLYFRILISFVHSKSHLRLQHCSLTRPYENILRKLLKWRGEKLSR